jgi:hypothetical protein
MPPESSALAVLSWVARGKAVAQKSTFDDAVHWLAANRAPEQAQRIYKASIGAGSTTNSTLGSEGIAIGAFSDSMRTASAFYRILSDNGFTRVPMQTRVGMVTSSPTAGVVAEGAGIPVSRVVLNNVVLAPIKAAALIVVTTELLLDVGAVGQACFSRELQSVVAAAVDTAFVDIVDTGTTPITSTSPTKDLRAALLAVNSTGIARPYWIAAEDVGKFASTLSTAAAGPAFAAASAVGGELANLPMLVSSGVPSGTLYLVDATGIAADGGPVTVDVSTQADVMMDTAPSMNSTTPTAAAMTSMFQTNSTALRALAIFGAAKIRSNAVAVVTGITTTTWAA